MIPRPAAYPLLVASATVLALAWLPAPAAQQLAPRTPNDLDAFMARVLERRAENWKTLHDYILSETERFAITGPANVALYGFRREFDWYVREGFLIRSPIRYDGVAIPEPERRLYEEHWLKEELNREARAAKPGAGKAAAAGERPRETGAAADGAPTVEGFVGQRIEPRFVSEAYFLKFKFEPGNYYFAGREKIEGRDVVRIEYYPSRLFSDDPDKGRGETRTPPADQARDKERQKERAEEDRIERSLNKVAQVTLWIDPSEFQIVRYTFDNVDFGFLPGRWLLRFDELRASMTMARVFDGAWLPREMAVRAGVSLASGSYAFEYGREFHDHKKAEVSARIRSIGPR